MKLQRVLDSLAVGELSQSTYVNENTGEIRPEKYKNVINSINLALTSLYTYFNIREKEVFIQLEEGKDSYLLDPIHALSNTDSVEDKFIIDSAEDPFTGNFLRINQAYNELGEEIAINDSDDPESLYLPDYNVVQVPNAVSTNVISLMYTAKDEELSLEEQDPATELGIPSTMLEMLVLYSASRLLGSLTAQDSQVRSQQLMSQYLMEVDRIDALNMYNTGDSGSNNKLEVRGFV